VIIVACDGYWHADVSEEKGERLWSCGSGYVISSTGGRRYCHERPGNIRRD
jgi:hypothetical protein